MDKRNFSRVVFNTKAVLKKGSQVIAGEVDNLSLKGMYIKSSDVIDTLNNGDLVDVKLSLTGTTSDLSISMKGMIRRKDDQGLGIEFTLIDLDSFSHLKYIVAYNSGEYERIMEEFENASKLKTINMSEDK